MNHYRPDFLSPNDYPWMERVLEVYRSCNGLSLSDLEERTHNLNIPKKTDHKYERLRSYLDGTLSQDPKSKISQSLRAEIFESLFALPQSPSSCQAEIIVNATQKKFGLDSPEALRQTLVSDLSKQRIIVLPREELTPTEVANESNLQFVKSLIRNASQVKIRLRGQVRRVIQTAKLKGLICRVLNDEPNIKGESCVLEISGPAIILFKTKMYGHALASLLGILPWCDSFILEAECQKGERSYKLKLSSSDPIKPSQQPKLFDSKLEEQFSRSFIRKFKNWNLVREPGPIDSNEGTIYPDFLISHQADPKKRFYCEIVGWWTPEYLKQKIKQWKSVKGENFILCISKDLGEANYSELPEESVYFFSKKVDVLQVMERMEDRLKHSPIPI